MPRSDPKPEIILESAEAASIWQTRNICSDRPGRPQDAVAIIEAPSRSVHQAGKAQSTAWLLRFQPGRPTFHDPVTASSGSPDPLAHLSIRFPSREAAVRYAERQGLAYQVREPPLPIAKAGANEDLDQQSTFQLCCWHPGPHALCCGEYPALKERQSHVEQTE